MRHHRPNPPPLRTLHHPSRPKRKPSLKRRPRRERRVRSARPGSAGLPIAGEHFSRGLHRRGGALGPGLAVPGEHDLRAGRLRRQRSDSRQRSLLSLNCLGISCGLRTPVSGFQVQSSSPTNSTPRSSSSSALWPAVWPKVSTTFGEPGHVEHVAAAEGLGTLDLGRLRPSAASHVEHEAPQGGANQQREQVRRRSVALLRAGLGQRGLVAAVDEDAGAGLAQGRRQAGVVGVRVGEHDGLDVARLRRRRRRDRPRGRRGSAAGRRRWRCTSRPPRRGTSSRSPSRGGGLRALSRRAECQSSSDGRSASTRRSIPGSSRIRRSVSGSPRRFRPRARSGLADHRRRSSPRSAATRPATSARSSPSSTSSSAPSTRARLSQLLEALALIVAASARPVR